MQLTINLTSGNQEVSEISESFGRGKCSCLSYRESNLLLIAPETIRLLVNHQLVPFLIQREIISLEQSCSYDYAATKDLELLSQLHFIVFFFRRQKTKTENGSRKLLPM